MYKKLKLNKAHTYSALAALLVLFSYQLAFRRTQDAWVLNRKFKAEQLSSANLQAQPDYLSRKNNNLATLVSQLQADSLVFKSEWVGAVSSIADQNRVKLISVPLTDTTSIKDGLLFQRLDLSGDFFSLLKVYNELLRSPIKGLVRSVSFKAPLRPAINERSSITMELYITAIK